MDGINSIAHVISNMGFPAAVAAYYIFFGQKLQRQQIQSFEKMTENIEELTKILREKRRDSERK